MSQDAMITLIILAIVIVLYATEKIPLVLTSILSMLAVYFFGIVDMQSAFSGFSHNAVMMIIGMSFIASAFYESGLIDKIAEEMQTYFMKKETFSEKKFLMIAGLLSAILSMFLNPLLITTIFMDIIDALSIQTKGKITRKNTVFPISIASLYGSMLTSISNATIILTDSLLADSEAGRTFYFFEPAVLGLPCLAVYFLYFGTFGYKLEQKCFRFDDRLPADSAASEDYGKVPYSKVKARITLSTLIACIALFIFTDLSLGAVAVAGGAFLCLTRCIDIKKALHEVNWSTTFLVAASIGFAKAIDVSGAGTVMANFVIAISGPLTKSPLGLCFLALLVSSVLSNVMNNSSTAVILVPIFISIAKQISIPLVPVVLAAGAGTGLATATPVCTAHITITTSVGYQFNDYLRVGGLINLLAIAVSTLSIYIIYLA